MGRVCPCLVSGYNWILAYTPVWHVVLTSEHFLDGIRIEDEQHVRPAHESIDFDTRSVLAVESSAYFVYMLHFAVAFKKMNNQVQ